MLNKVSRMTLAGQVVSQIKEMFLSGELLPDHDLPDEQALVQRLLANREALREALRALEHAGVVRSHPDGRLYVTDALSLRGHLQNLESVIWLFAHWEIAEVRKIVEVAGVTLAIQRGKPADFKTIRETHAVLCTTVDDSQRFVLADVAFHRAIADAAGNGMLDLLLQDMWAMTSEYNLKLLITRAERERVRMEHEQLLHFMENARIDDAVRAIESHLDTMVGIMRRRYEAAISD